MKVAPSELVGLCRRRVLQWDRVQGREGDARPHGGAGGVGGVRSLGGRGGVLGSGVSLVMRTWIDIGSGVWALTASRGAYGAQEAAALSALCSEGVESERKVRGSA